MGKENFIRDALHKPDDYIAYHVGRELAELYPGKAIMEGATGYFDLDGFVRAKKCELVHELSLFNHIRTEWTGKGKTLRRRVTNSWMNVLWKDQLLDVILLTFGERCYPSRHQWIVADTIQQCEAFFAEVCEWSAEVRGEVLVFQDGEWERNKELLAAIKAATFDNLILRGSLKDDIQSDLVQFFAARETYERYHIPWKRGVLFTGPPGNGKTHTVKALINQLQKPCLYVKGFKSEYATDQENIALVFERARMATPCMLVFEDLDAMLDDTSRSLFLNELDGFETNSGIVVLATTNHPERLDPAIVDRPSRFDRKYHFEPPAQEERHAYIGAWNKQLEPELRLCEFKTTEVVQLTEGFSFAYMKELFLASMMQWMEKRTSMGEVMIDQARRLRQQLENANVVR